MIDPWRCYSRLIFVSIKQIQVSCRDSGDFIIVALIKSISKGKSNQNADMKISLCPFAITCCKKLVSIVNF